MGGAASLVAVPGARVSRADARQGQLPDQLARAGRARRLLSRRRQRHLQEVRHRLRRPPGRPAAEPLAAAARRARRHDHVELVRGHQLRQGEPAVPGDRRDLPEGPAGHHLASECRPRQVRGPEGQADPDRRRRPHQLLAVPQGALRLHRRAGAALHLQHGAVPRRQADLAAGLPVVRALRDHAGRRAAGGAPDRRRRLRQLPDHDQHLEEDGRREEGRGAALRQRVGRRLGRIHEGRRRRSRRRTPRSRKTIPT